jgi:hypothetical protein
MFLIMPFLLLRLRGIEITFEQYVDTLKEISKSHFIGKALHLQFNIESLVYFIFTAGLYFLQTYQNINSCYRYHENITKMNGRLIYLKHHIRLSMKQMEVFLEFHQKKTHPAYQLFCKDVQARLDRLAEMHRVLEPITPFSYSLSKSMDIGTMLQIYYQFHANESYETCLRYSVGFSAYVEHLGGIYTNIQHGYLGVATFAEDSEPVFESQYYPPHQTYRRDHSESEPKSSVASDVCVRNNCGLKQNIILTGVNASGKTTFLKTTAINILVTQQFGVGFYSTCSMRPFTHIHSYLNIPDTSGRDSLFQAESRRCKEIIDIVSEADDQSRHFCIFDELYSGTNPTDAGKSASAFLKYLGKYSNLNFMLTTHYVYVCKKFKKSKKIRNYKMGTVPNGDNGFKMTYKLEQGISKIQGAVKILKDMNYPQEMIDTIENSRSG